MLDIYYKAINYLFVLIKNPEAHVLHHWMHGGRTPPIPMEQYQILHIQVFYICIFVFSVYQCCCSIYCNSFQSARGTINLNVVHLSVFKEGLQFMLRTEFFCGSFRLRMTFDAKCFGHFSNRFVQTDFVRGTGRPYTRPRLIRMTL